MYAILSISQPILIVSSWLPYVSKSPRLLFVIASALTVSLISAEIFAIYFQVVWHWQPCIDCWVERVLMLVGIISLTTWLGFRGIVVGWVLLLTGIAGYSISFIQLFLNT